MPLTRGQKHNLVDEYRKLVEESSGFYVFDYRGLNVDAINELRNKVRENGSKMFVIKNRMLKRAISDKNYNGMDEQLIGPSAVIFAGEDPVAPAKTLVNFAKDHEAIKIKAGAIGESYMDASQVEALSKIPSQMELYSKILGGIKAPPSNLLGCIKGMHNKIHGLMVSYAKKLEEEAA